MSGPAPVAPVATYRLQLTPEHGFEHAIGLLDHLERLGISHVYLSPVAQAVPDSSHGYDVVDHTAVRAEFGGADGFETLLDTVAARGMAVVFDHVPNHVSGARPDLNAPWWAVLRDGRTSPEARWFDIDWDVAGDDRVIVPVLGDSIDRVLADGALDVDGDALVVYGERRLPLAAGTAGLPLAELLDRQHYRLQHWREPARNVRRFFTVDDLIAVRVEDPSVAAVVDTLPARYAEHPGFGGVRIDHIDGLADPAGYLARLRSVIGADALLWVEKIVAPGEELPTDWPVDGTTGYEFIRDVDHVLLPAAAKPIVAGRWLADSADDRSFHTLEHDAKREVIRGGLAPDVDRLVRVAAHAVGDVEHDAVAAEVHRLVTELPRYRTYLPDDSAAEQLIGQISDGPVAAAILTPATPAQHELRTRWQQLSGPVMAKGAEDRAFYRYLRLASLCEVGGDPGGFGLAVTEFHAANAVRAERWPMAMLAASTHDTKRSSDVRAWSTAFAWTLATDDGLAERWRGLVERAVAATGVDAVAATLAVQTAATTPDLDAERLGDYLVKALREGAQQTSWEHPDHVVERRFAPLADHVVASAGPLADELAPLGRAISLIATTLHLTSPGVPDVYQGTEGFSHRLVDPDNRVPPDWPALAGAVADERSVADLFSAGDPAVKPVLVRELLALRRRHPDAFVGGAYVPIDAGDDVIAYRRADAVVVALRRDGQPLGPFDLPPGDWREVLGGAGSSLPVAVYERG